MDRISLPRRLTKEIYNEFNKINFILENLTSKLECLKEVEKNTTNLFRMKYYY